jgi:hypothetical protein
VAEVKDNLRPDMDTAPATLPAESPALARGRRLWLPWRPRFRPIFAFPRGWHLVVVGLDRFDAWATPRFLSRGRPLVVRIIGWVVLLPAFIVVRFLGLVAVLEVTIVAFGAALYLVGGEWLLLLVLFPMVLVARLARALPWRVLVRGGEWDLTARIRGWGPSRQAAVDAAHALERGTGRAVPPWSRSRHRARVWT